MLTVVEKQNQRGETIYALVRADRPDKVLRFIRPEHVEALRARLTKPRPGPRPLSRPRLVENDDGTGTIVAEDGSVIAEIPAEHVARVREALGGT